MKTKAVLMELFELLEAYSPSWYSEEQRDRAVAALKYSDKPALSMVKPSPSRQTASTPAEQGTLLQQQSSYLQ